MFEEYDNYKEEPEDLKWFEHVLIVIVTGFIIMFIGIVTLKHIERAEMAQQSKGSENDKRTIK